MPLLKTALLRRTAATVLVALLATSALARPEGVGTVTIAVPQTTAPLPMVQNYLAQTGVDANGVEGNKYDWGFNPVLQILSGFDKIWTLGDAAWHGGAANGDGAQDYSQVAIVNAPVWAGNMRYVLDVTGPARTEAEALAAYLDDRRAQGYSVIEGMGPLLAPIYRDNAGAVTTINHTLADFDVLNPQNPKEDDEGTEAGVEGSALLDFLALMQLMRGPAGTTSPAKYFYASPRPWRMTDTGEVIQTGDAPFGDSTIEVYDSNTGVIPALLSARDARGRGKDGGFPSGHTNAAYLAALAYAYAMPERFEELLTRASELGENRVVTGMHSPLDVMGGRIMAMAVGASVLSDPANAEAKAAAFANMQAVMAQGLPADMTLLDAADVPTNDRWADEYANASLYRQRMTYGLPQDPAMADAPVTIPAGAEVLLETRLPYLDADARRVVLATTALAGGYPLVDDSNGWGRIDIVAAAGGFGAFPGDVTVVMDADKGGLNVRDTWVHDIAGPGLLTKAGSGTLVLAGHNSYTGGTILSEGMLVARAADSLGAGEVLVEGGQLVVGAAGVVLQAPVEVTGGVLVVDAALEAGTPLIALQAPQITGAFTQAQTADGQPLAVTQTAQEITVALQ
ncbi:serine protease [Ketogulonicigenium robustum]|uniref:Serine protease n=1 Tax=Ketogulonicigenium robustum TaxID=92947 RepID=A0A1W6P1J8_9RHOB|nr:phosphatase PAP2 family protein [Ketogulonicigenium robustum]ARO15303.1 serine protease [Ketogulonicigenium robustum]